jgi:chromate transporter
MLEPVTLGRLGLFFLELGATGFGGPIALAGSMQRVLVDERRWISRDEYVAGLALAQLVPGPLATQLAMYLGYVRGGVFGATVVAVAFVLPSFLMVWAMAAAYVRFGGLWWMQAALYGIGAAVVGVIARSVVRLATLTLRRNTTLIAIALVLAVTTAVTARENLWLFVLSGFIPILARRRVRSSAPMSVLFLGVMTPVTGQTAAGTSLASIGWFFMRAGAVVFGSGLAIVPFLYGGVVQDRHWLTEQQFVDAVAVAMITPGPVVITVGFIGYLVRGIAGMVVAAVAVFLPAYLMVIAAAPSFRRYHTYPAIKDYVSGVTAAATGAIAGAAVLLAQRTLVDVWTMVIALATALALWRSRVPEVWLILGAGALGLWLR